MRGEVAYRRAFLARIRGVVDKNIDKSGLLDVEVFIDSESVGNDDEVSNSNSN